MTNFEKHINVEVNSRQNPSKALVTYNTEVLKQNIFGGRNRLTQDMLSAKNTKYVIKWNYVLNEDIVIPTGCILQFDGGNITNDNDKNYTITGQDTILESCQYESEILKKILESLINNENSGITDLSFTQCRFNTEENLNLLNAYIQKNKNKLKNLIISKKKIYNVIDASDFVINLSGDGSLALQSIGWRPYQIIQFGYFPFAKSRFKSM